LGRTGLRIDKTQKKKKGRILAEKMGRRKKKEKKMGGKMGKLGACWSEGSKIGKVQEGFPGRWG